MSTAEIFAALGLLIAACAGLITVLAWLFPEDPEHWNPWW